MLMFVPGCGSEPAKTAPASLPTPTQGVVTVENKQAKVGEEFAVSGSFELEGEGAKPQPVIVKIRSSKGVTMAERTAPTTLAGGTVTFKCNIEAPKKPGDYHAIAFTGKKEISRTDVSVKSD